MQLFCKTGSTKQLLNDCFDECQVLVMKQFLFCFFKRLLILARGYWFSVLLNVIAGLETTRKESLSGNRMWETFFENGYGFRIID